jgi:hypothetical protein
MAEMIAKTDESDISVAFAQFIPMGSYVSFEGNVGESDKSGSSVQIRTLQGIVVKADIVVNWDKGDNPPSSGNSVFSVVYDILLVTDEGDETDITYKSVKSDLVTFA